MRKKRVAAIVLIACSIVLLSSTVYAGIPADCWYTGNQETDVIWDCNYCLNQYGNYANPDEKNVFVWKEYMCPNDPTHYWDLYSWTTTCSYWSGCTRT